MKKSLFLIDGNSLLNRAYYALPPLTTIEGEPTNAVYGFSMMLVRLLDDYKPSQVVVAFDVSAPTFRHHAYTKYKANRKGMPDDLRPQVNTLKEVLDAWGIARLELAGYEADDIIGTAAKKAEAAGFQVRIVTGDRDALQLISEQTKVLLTKRGIKEVEEVDLERLKQEYEVTPEQVIELKGLMGDKSDNIPGVPGVGEKTALKLLKSHQSIEQLYQQIDQEKGKLQERLLKHHDQAILSKNLATIDCDVPIDIDLTYQGEQNNEELNKLFQRLEFKSLVERVIPDEYAIENKLEQELTAVDYQKLDHESLALLEADLNESQEIGVNLAAQELGIATLKRVWYISDNLVEVVYGLLADLNTKTKIHTNNSKELIKLVNFKQDFNIDIDVFLAGYLLDPGNSLDLTSLSVRYSSLAPLNETEDEAQNIATIAQRILELSSVLEQELTKSGLIELYRDLELPLSKVLAQMEVNGIICNREKLTVLSQEMQATLKKLTEEIHEIAGEEFNINSPKQLGVILFEKLGLPVIKRTKTGPSTSAEVLEQLSYHPIVNKILEFRQINKLKSTYTDSLAALINPDTKRIHTTFNQTVTTTGRLSSAHPNLQNIPIRTFEGRKIRGTFEPQVGWYLVAADYSQIELRVLAHISGDQGMIDGFNSGVDIHTRTASEIFNIPLDQVTTEDRDSAKAINFGIVYGISSFGLSQGTNLSQAKAQKYIDQYFKRYPNVKEYLDRSIQTARDQGYVTTLLKRRRYLTDINSKNYQRRSFAQRTAMNTPIQGSAADIIKLAMLRVDELLTKEKLSAQILLQVHDELVLEVPKSELIEVTSLVKSAMESVMDLAVKLVVDVKVGLDWETVKPMGEVK